jgi:NAD(P)-dependent dehydrogenase (short-subunit alcohol dehydrogenase family)
VSGAAARLSGKRVVVTGAARGIGLEFAQHLAGLGADVLAVDIDEPGLSQLASGPTARSASPGMATPIRTAVADVSSAAQTRALAQDARELLGGLDALVNNAAIVAGLTRRPFDEIDDDEWDRVLRVNVTGTWLCTRALAPLLREAGGGSIVNLASEVAFSGSSGLLHYVTSKAAIVGMTRALARELGPAQIRVNALAPGFIATEGSRGMLSTGSYDVSGTPLGRVGQPQDLLGAVAFLVSDESAFVSGQTLLVNGGRLVR